MTAMNVRILAMVCASVDIATGKDTGQYDSIRIQQCQLLDNGVLIPLSNSSPHQSSHGISKETKPYNGFAIASRPESIVISPLQRHAPLGIGKTVYTSQRTPVVLVTEVMVNSDSITYTTNQQGIWAKIYASTSLTTLTEEKCKRMLSKTIQCDGLCWPTDILRDADGVFAGVLVPQVAGVPLSLCVFKGGDNGIRKFFPNWDKRQLTQLTITILRKIMYLHSMGILFGCLNPASIIVKDEKTVFFVDVDQYQIEGFPCVIRNTMFTPPELQDKLRRNKMYLCTTDHEKYAVALLVFMTLMPGKMPYPIEDNVHAPDSIIKQNFAFSYKGEHGSDRTVGSWKFVWSHLTPFKEKFYRTFQSGERFNAPNQRLSDNVWLATALDFFKEIDGQELYDPHTRELVPKSFKRFQGIELVRCNYCGIEHPRKTFFTYDYFFDYKICKSCLEEPSKVSFTCTDCGRKFIYTNRTAIYHARMRERDDSWKTQKHCRDCKSKMTKCSRCGRDVPLYQVGTSNGYCPECRTRDQARRNAIYSNPRCPDCGRYFEITVGEHESFASRQQSDPIRCRPCREARRRNRY
jgi:DNA-directed RNA polymerase subunit RPC12/RpoP